MKESSIDNMATKQQPNGDIKVNGARSRVGDQTDRKAPKVQRPERRHRRAVVALTPCEAALILVGYGMLAYVAGLLLHRWMHVTSRGNNLGMATKSAKLEECRGRLSLLARIGRYNSKTGIRSAALTGRQLTGRLFPGSAEHNLSPEFSWEALVHPAMLAHDNPARILILSNSIPSVQSIQDEVVKHSTVRLIVTIPRSRSDPDKTECTLLDWTRSRFSTDHAVMKATSDWSSMVSSTRPPCFHHKANSTCTNVCEPGAIAAADSFDVILVASATLDETVMQFLFQRLTPDGTLAMSIDNILGQNPNSDTATRALAASNFASTLKLLEQVGYASVVDYSEHWHSGGGQNQAYVVAMKNRDTRANWFLNEAEMTLRISLRTKATVAAASKRESSLTGSSSPFRFFDAATTMQYQFTSRIVEKQWCETVAAAATTNASAAATDNQSRPDNNSAMWCNGGHGFHPDYANIPMSSFVVRPSEAANLAGRGVYATRFIPKGSVLAMEEYVHLIFVPSRTRSLMDQALYSGALDKSSLDFWEVVFLGYIEGYGFRCFGYGPMAAAVEPSIFSFLNHGCNGTYNTGMALDETEQTVPLGRGPVGIVKDDMLAYHPWLSRHFPSSPDDINIALRDIQAGEEILENYLVFGGVESIEDWDENLSELQTICAGGSGLISPYEQEDVASA